MNKLPQEAIDLIEKTFPYYDLNRSGAEQALTDPVILAAAGLYTKQQVDRMVEQAKTQALTDPKVYEPAGLVKGEIVSYNEDLRDSIYSCFVRTNNRIADLERQLKAMTEERDGLKNQYK